MPPDTRYPGNGLMRPSRVAIPVLWRNFGPPSHPARVAQLVEHQLPKLRVASSNLVSRSLIQSQLPKRRLTLFVSDAHAGAYGPCFRRREGCESGFLLRPETVGKRPFSRPVGHGSFKEVGADLSFVLVRWSGKTGENWMLISQSHGKIPSDEKAAVVRPSAPKPAARRNRRSASLMSASFCRA